MEDKRLHDLERLLLRVLVIIEEAEGRHITNPAMVYQLNLLRKEMYRGYFTMDNLRSQGIESESHDVSPSFAISKFNPTKRLFFSTISAHRDKDLQQVIDNLNNMVRDAYALAMFLKNYPPLYRQPYSMHLFVGKSMFGRQMEMERIMDFLFEREPLGTGSVQILPIVGPRYVGKSTLVAHICNDARVRNYFSQTIKITGDDINNKLSTLNDGVAIMHKENALGENKKVLAIVELSGDVDEVSWNGLFLSSICQLGRGSRIIITSRSNKVIKLGTTQPIVLNFLPPEAYWYFFKILTFGSTNSSDYPELQSIAMVIARGLNGSFISANVHSGLLRNNNLVAKQWRMHLASLREHIERNASLYNVENAYDVVQKRNRPLCWKLKDDKLSIWYKECSCLAEENVPTITIEDVLFERVKCEGAFDILVWKSHIPPYKFYILRCTVESGLKKDEVIH
ncbi:unnamed protein product [Urochloa decumbens]|uniref:NB-ARC domain-containing protein n=1 Tax=Urochloa decumbens TaxID=240449 RepID=A0ABC9FLR9_9POAL